MNGGQIRLTMRWASAEGWVMKRVTWVRESHKVWVYWRRSRGSLSQWNESCDYMSCKPRWSRWKQHRGNCRTIIWRWVFTWLSSFSNFIITNVSPRIIPQRFRRTDVIKRSFFRSALSSYLFVFCMERVSHLIHLSII